MHAFPSDSGGSPPAAPSKTQLRRASLERRKACAALAPESAGALAARLTELLGHHQGAIAGYVPIGSEIDPRPALSALAAAGARLVLPVAAARGDRLLFRNWSPGDPLVPGPFGTLNPVPGAPMTDPDVLLIPLLAFDATGHRLGYGAGYYDRTLAVLRSAGTILAIGLAYDAQEVPPLPSESHDQRLDMVVTDRRTLRFSG
jgi:5-formyltetrahydrofolate cyclo-ligase